MNVIFFNNIYRNKYTSSIIRLISFLLGGVFVFSGIAKLFSITHFADEFAQYVDLYLNIAVLLRYRLILSIGICVLEISIGLWSFFSVDSIPLSVVTILVLFVFTFFTGQNYFFPAFGQGIDSCGCFGDVVSLAPKWSFVKCLVLVAISSIKLILLKIRIIAK